MAVVRVYGRETTFQRISASGPFAFSSAILSFDSIPDPTPDTRTESAGAKEGMRFELGRRFTIDIEVPEEAKVDIVYGVNRKCLVMPGGECLAAFDVTRKAYEAVEGYRVTDTQLEN